MIRQSIKVIEYKANIETVAHSNFRRYNGQDDYIKYNKLKYCMVTLKISVVAEISGEGRINRLFLRW